jgi:hypothetical protein
MLLSDPHAPWFGSMKWHEAHLIVDDRWIYGVTLLGCPGVTIGFAQDLAWGVTNNGADTRDIYRLTLDPSDLDRYRYDGRWREVDSQAVVLENCRADGVHKDLLCKRGAERRLQAEHQRGNAAYERFAARYGGVPACGCCKQRCTCPSCHQKRALLTSIHVAQDVCAPVPHRQVVLTIPKRLRLHTRFDRKLPGSLCSCAWTCLQAEVQRLLGRRPSLRDGARVVPGTCLSADR